MPYPHILPLIKEPVTEGEVPYTILHPNMPTSWEEMQKSWIQLKEERNTFEASFYASEKKVLELTRRLHEEETLNTMVVKIIAPPENMFLITNGPSYVGVHLPLGSLCGKIMRLITRSPT